MQSPRLSEDWYVLMGIRRLIKATELGRSLKCFVELTVDSIEEYYRLCLRHRLPDNESGQMFAGMRIFCGNICIDYYRERGTDIVWTADQNWPKFDLADPNCFDEAIDYIRAGYNAGSDAGLKRYVRSRVEARTAG